VPIAAASDWKEDQAKADQYYAAKEFSKAFNLYYKVAKIGASHSQDMVAQMYANGEGTKLDLEEAYAWSVLAAERGAADIVNRRDQLLQQVGDKQAAEKRAEKLLSKYGREARQKKADSKAQLKQNTKSGGCTGSKLSCR
jgi:TPR repeat protein